MRYIWPLLLELHANLQEVPSLIRISMALRLQLPKTQAASTLHASTSLTSHAVTCQLQTLLLHLLGASP